MQHSRIRRRQVYKSGGVFSIGPNAFRYFVLVLIAVFSLFYLIQSAQGSDYLIEIRRLEDTKDSLTKEMTTLKVNDSRIRSLQNLQQSASSQGLVPISGITESITVKPSP
jgi:hypothetical protein